MKPTIRAVAVATLALGSACAPARAAHPATLPSHAPAATAAAQDTSRLTVTGTASVRVAADRVRVQVAVETEAATAEAASRDNAATMTRVLERVRPAAGAEARIETTGYQLSPRYRQSPDREGPPEIAGYRAVNQVVVVLEDVDRTGRVLDAALEAGANRVTGLSFFASDTDAARLDALRQATERARAEAAAVAEALGLMIHSAETIQTSSGGMAPVFRSAAMEMQAMDTPVEAGSQSVEASVTITYRLLPEGAR